MSNKRNRKAPNNIVNRRASFDYSLQEELVVGIVLNGPETRAARDGHVQLKGSYVTIRDNELWLNNASLSLKINEKGQTGKRTIDTNPRKLLAKRKQINELSSQKIAGMSVVPIKFLTNGRFIKVVIALGKGKKTFDKREVIKRRDLEREAKKPL